MVRRSAVALLTVLLFGSVAVGQVSSAESQTGFVSLFNGKDLSGWEGDPRLW